MLNRNHDKALYDLYKHLDSTYFSNSLYVSRIEYAKFFRDYINRSITYGLFVYSPEERIIYINKYLLSPIIIKNYPFVVECALYHELCHAFLALNKMPFRFGKYLCDHHGPEFWQLMNEHPLSEKFHRLAQTSIAHVVHGEIEFEAEKYLKKNHPKLYSKIHTGGKPR